jgi:hypothetical protein
MKDDNDFNVQIKIWNISHKKEIMSYFNIFRLLHISHKSKQNQGMG